MAPPALLRRNSAGHSRRGRMMRTGVAAVAGLALGAAWSSLLAPQSFTIAGPAVLERPSAKADDRVDASADRGSEQRKIPNVGKSGKAKFNTTVVSESGHPDRRSQEVTTGPPWATCFVEYEAQGRPALEEWVMRGEQDNLNAFRSWRKAGSSDIREPMNVRCAPASPQAVEEAMCIQCVSHAGTSSISPAGGLHQGVATVQGQVVSSFIDIKQCMADTTDGKGFCMSGHVVVPV